MYIGGDKNAMLEHYTPIRAARQVTVTSLNIFYG
jgi:hypothetical protein